MITEFSIHPIEAADSGENLGRMVEVLKSAQVPYRLGPMGACIEGDWDQIMAVIQRCRQVMAPHHERVITTIVLDDAKAPPHRLKEIAKHVQTHRSRMPHGDMEVEC